MAIANVLISQEKNKYFIDLSCNKEHNGKNCECKNVYTTKRKRKARSVATKIANKFKVPLLCVGENLDGL